jgi:hypothetical protein
VPPDIVRCTGAIQLRTSHSWEFQGALYYNSPDCPMSQRSNDSLRANGRIVRRNSDEQCRAEVRAQKSEGTGLSGVASDCPVQQDDKGSNGRPALNPNGCADVARTGQCTVAVRWRTGLSGAPIASSLHQRLWKSLGAINTPTTSFISIQAFQTSHSLQEQKTSLLDTFNRSNPLQASKSTQFH